MKIQLENLTKIYPERVTSPASFLNLERKGNIITALKDLSFVANQGDIVGLIGQNGAGKSTLLRVIAGIASPTKGNVVRQGKVRALLDISAGLNLLNTGRENIWNLLRLYGFSAREIKDLEQDIIVFSELEKTIDNPVLSYSSGMRIRLAFAICTASTAEILLLDEVLAVGDEFFAAKSFRRLMNFVKRGGCCFIASHDWTKIFRISTRILWIEQGEIVKNDISSNVLYPFLKHINAYKTTDEVKIYNIRFFNNENVPIHAIYSGDSLILEFSYKKQSHVKEFAVIVGCMDNQTGESIFSAWSPDFNQLIGNGSLSGTVRIRYDSLPLRAGEYDFCILCVDPAQGAFPLTYYHVSWRLTQETPAVLKISNKSNDITDAIFTLHPEIKIIEQKDVCNTFSQGIPIT